MQSAFHVPGDLMQFDFTPVKLVVAGVLTDCCTNVRRPGLSYSGRIFCVPSRCARIRSPLSSRLISLGASRARFGGVPRVGVFDNAKTAVTRILRVAAIQPRENRGLPRLLRQDWRSKSEFAAPAAKGNEKGGVEGANGFVEDNMFRPIPSARISRRSTFALERPLPERWRRAGRRCIARETHRQSGSLVKNDPAPATAPSITSGRLHSLDCNASTSLPVKAICDTGTAYSVPTQWAHRGCGARTLQRSAFASSSASSSSPSNKRCTGKAPKRCSTVRHAIELVASPTSIAASNAPRSLRKENFRRRCWPCRDRLLAHDRARASRAFVAVLRLLLTYSSAGCRRVRLSSADLRNARSGRNRVVSPASASASLACRQRRSWPCVCS